MRSLLISIIFIQLIMLLTVISVGFQETQKNSATLVLFVEKWYFTGCMQAKGVECKAKSIKERNEFKKYLDGFE